MKTKSELEKLIDSLPEDVDEAVDALVAFDWEKDDYVEYGLKKDKIVGYFEKENEGIAENSMEDLGRFYFSGRLSEEVYFAFLRKVAET